MIKEFELNKINEYIKNPISNGLWESIFHWKPDNKLVDLLLAMDDSNINDSYYNTTERRYKSLSVDFKNNPLCILSLLREVSRQSDPAFMNIGLHQEFYDLIIKVKGSVKLSELEFSEIIPSYKEYTDDMFLSNKEIIINGEVSYIYQIRDESSNNFIILSTDEKIIKILDSIFILVGCADLLTSRKLFSPKSKLISPYFYYINIVSRDFFTDISENSNFIKSYGYFTNFEYENCISTIGKSCELTLSNIYETLFREHSSNGTTIGQLQNTIESKIRAMYRVESTQIQPSSFKDIFDDCKRLENSDNTGNTDVIASIRNIAKLLINEQKYNESIAKNSSKSNHEYTIFPKHIRKYLKELLYLRNTASHNSGVYLGINDALMMLFYYISLYTWWQKTYNSIDWSNDESAIIKLLVESQI